MPQRRGLKIGDRRRFGGVCDLQDKLLSRVTFNQEVLVPFADERADGSVDAVAPAKYASGGIFRELRSRRRQHLECAVQRHVLHPSLDQRLDGLFEVLANTGHKTLGETAIDRAMIE